MADAAQTIHRKAAGLFTFPSPLDVPPGALQEATNAVVDRDGVISSRRGFGYVSDLSEPASQSFEYLGRLLVFEGGKLRYDAAGDGILVDWLGIYAAPPGQRMRGLEIDGKFIFLTDKGPFIQESASSTPRRAGFPQGLDLQLALTGTGLGGFFEPDSQIAYKVVLGQRSLPPGAPSFHEAIANAKYPVTLTKATTTITVTGHTAHGYTTGDTVQVIDPVDLTYEPGPHAITVTTPDAYTYTVAAEPTAASTTATEGKILKVLLTATLPEEALAGWWIEIHRTFLSADQNTEPGDFFYKVARYTLTSTDITNGYITFTDTRGDDFLQEELYTNAGTREGQAGANDRPPFSLFLSAFRGHTFYGNIRREHEATVQLLDVAGVVNGDTFTIASGGISTVFTAGAVEDLGARTFKLWTTEPLASVNVRKTAKSLIHVINRTAGPVSGFYPDLEVGLIILRRRDLLDVEFTLSSSKPALWQGIELVSDPNAKPFQVARSKFQKPEAVPTLSTNEVGKITIGINGMVPLRESLLIFSPGAWELTGETDGLAGKSFFVRELDTGIKLIAPDTLVALDGSAFFWSDQGILRVSPAGSAIVSRQIEDIILKATQYPNFSKAFAVSYESYHKYLLFYPTSWASDTCDGVLCYDYLQSAGGLAGSWAGPWDKPASCGIVLPSTDAGKLYIGRADVAKISLERKTFVGSEDYTDEDDACTVTAFVGMTVTVSWTGPDLRRGWLFRQGSYSSLVTAAVDNEDGTWTLTLKDTIFPATGAATIAAPIDLQVRWVDDAAGNPSTMKQFGPAIFTFDRDTALTHEIGFSSDTNDGVAWLQEIIQEVFAGWGAEWGREWGDPGPGRVEPLRVPVPRDHARCRRIGTYYRHRTARERVELLQMSLGARVYSDRVVRAPA